jgi:hypothetical protein
VRDLAQEFEAIDDCVEVCRLGGEEDDMADHEARSVAATYLIVFEGGTMRHEATIT